MWELLAGCLLACGLPAIQRAALAGWALITAGAVASIALGVVAGGWPARTGALSMAVVAASAGTIVAVSAGGLRWLGWWPLPQVGAISYGVYLYHYPITQAVTLAGPRSVQTVVKLAAVLALAWASHRWMEKPLRDAVARRLGRDVRDTKAVPAPESVGAGR